MEARFEAPSVYTRQALAVIFLATVVTLFINKGRNAFLATGAKIGGAVYLAREFFAFGQVNLEFTEIGGSLNCEGGFFLHHRLGIQNRDAQEPALNLESSNIRGSVYLTNGFLAIGKVNLQSLIVRNHLDCGGGHFSPNTSPLRRR